MNKVHLSDITLKFRTAIIFSVANVQAVFQKQFIDMSVICLHAKVHISSSSRSLALAVKLKLKLNCLHVRHVVTLPTATDCVKKSCILFDDTLSHKIL
jgi:hypothetical protein